MTCKDQISPLVRGASVADLLRLQREIRLALKERGVTRTNNQPVADYAEWLICQFEGGKLATNSQKSWDVETEDGLRVQVKCRQITPENPSRQLSPIRSWKFDRLAVVLFDEWGAVTRAVYLAQRTVEEHARWSDHVHGHLVIARDSLLAQGVDLTDRLLSITASA